MYIVYYILFIVYNILYIVYCILYIIYYILYIVYCILYIVCAYYFKTPIKEVEEKQCNFYHSINHGNLEVEMYGG